MVNTIKAPPCFLLVISFIIFIPVIFTSCGMMTGHYRIYPGDALPSDQIALLINNRYLFSERPTVWVKRVDDKKVGESIWNEELRLELLPGYHTIRLRYLNVRGMIYSSDPPFLDVRFYAIAGYLYVVDADLLEGHFSEQKESPLPIWIQRRWKPKILDITSCYDRYRSYKEIGTKFFSFQVGSDDQRKLRKFQECVKLSPAVPISVTQSK